MGFLAPAIFAPAAALLAAILATYLLRPKRPTRRVSSTFLWLAALPALAEEAPPGRVGRVGFVSGQLAVFPPGESD